MSQDRKKAVSDKVSNNLLANVNKLQQHIEVKEDIKENMIILMKNKSVIPDVIQHRPKEDFGEYCNMSVVKAMIKDSTQWIIETLPKINAKIQTNHNTIRDFQSSQKGMLQKIEDLQGQVKEMNVFEQKLQQINGGIRNSELKTMERLTTMDNQITVQNNCLQTIKDNITRMGEQIYLKEKQINKVEQIMDGRADDLKKQFDKFFKTLSKDFKAQQEMVQLLQKRMEKVAHSADTAQKQMKSTLLDQIKDWAERQRIDSAKFQQMEFDQFALKKSNRRLDLIEIQFKGLQNQIQTSNSVNLFISKTLPVLLHLKICEGLQEVTGKDYQKQLIDFERKKIKELYNYSKVANFSCINVMHQRLEAHAKKLAQKDRGCTYLTFGEDVKPDMEYAEATYFDLSLEQQIEKRYASMVQLQVQLKDAYDLLIREKHRNTRMIQYKLNDIDESIVLKLRRKIIEFKVKQMKDYSDLDCIFSEQSMERKLINQADAIDGGNTQLQTSQPTQKNEFVQISQPVQKKNILHQRIEIPKEIFVWRRDKMRNYAKFNHKFEAKFELAMEVLNNFKEIQDKRLQDTTNLQLCLNLEFDQLKQVMGELQDSFDSVDHSNEDFIQKIEQNIHDIHIIRKDIITHQMAVDQGLKEQRNIKQLITSNQMRNENHHTMFKNDIEKIIKENKDIRLENKKFDNQRKSEQATIKMKISQLEANQTTSYQVGSSTIGTIDFGNVGKIVAGKVDESFQEESSIIEGNAQDSKEELTTVEQQSIIDLEGTSSLNEGSKKQSQKDSRPVSRQESVKTAEEIEFEKEEQKEKEKITKMNAVKQRIALALEKQNKRKVSKKVFKPIITTVELGIQILDNLAIEKEKKAEEDRKLNEKLEKLSTIEKVNLKNQMRRQTTLKLVAEAAMKKKKEDDEFEDEEQKRGRREFSKRYGINIVGEEGKVDLQKLASIAGFSMGGGGVTELQLQEQLELKLKDFRQQLDFEFGTKLKIKFSEMHDLIEKSRVDLEGDLLDKQIVMESNMDNRIIDVEKLFDKGLRQMQFNVKNIEDQLSQENGEFIKLKRDTKNEIRFQLDKLQKNTNDTEHEFQRINLIIEKIQSLVGLLTEDQMMTQLLLQQDILDRKQIGLFGTKKNSQILGVNQGAMNNNTKIEPSGSRQRSARDSPEKSQKEYWTEVQNKNKSYQEIVKGKQPSDYLHKLHQQDQINNLETIHEKGSIIPVGQQNFINKLESDTQYNTLFIDKNCSSCNGFAPAILSQIKLACLSYVNSPVQFGKEKVPMSDMVEVKDIMLKKCELYINSLEQIKLIPSHFGALNLVSQMNLINREIDQEQPSFDQLNGSVLFNPNFHTSQDNNRDAYSELDQCEASQPIVAPNKLRKTLQINDSNINMTQIKQKTLFDKFIRGMSNDNLPKFKINTLSQLISRRNYDIGKASKTIQKDLFNILDIKDSMKQFHTTGPLCQLKMVDKLNLQNLKLRSDAHVSSMAMKYLGVDEEPPQFILPKQIQAKNSMCGTKRTTVMTKRNMTIDSGLSQDMKVLGEQSQINNNKMNHVQRYKAALKLGSDTPQGKIIGQPITHKAGSKFKARGNSVSGHPQTTLSNTTISNRNTRAKTPSNFSHGGKGFGSITTHTGINGGIFSQNEIGTGINGIELNDTMRNIKEYEQELLHSSKIVTNNLTPEISTQRNPNSVKNSIKKQKR